MSRPLRIARIWRQSYGVLPGAFYQAHPHLMTAGHAEQRAAILGSRLVYGDSFSRAMQRQGHACTEIIPNMHRLQLAWARENGLAVPQTLPPTEATLDTILVAQLRALAPEVLFVQGLNAYPPGYWPAIRAAVPGIRRIVAHVGYRLGPGQADGVDHLFLCSPAMLRPDELPGVPRSLLYHWFDPEAAVASAPVGERPHRFVFAGTGGTLAGDYEPRFALLVRLVVEAGLECWPADLPLPVGSPRPVPPADPADGADPARRAAGLLDWVAAHPRRGDIILSDLFPAACRPAVFGTAMHRLLADADLTINLHTADGQGMAGNMRLFEATGQGCCLLTDAAGNLAELFEPGREVVAFASAAEAVERARWLLAHPAEMRRIAAAGRAATLSRHLVDHRCAEILAVLKALDA